MREIVILLIEKVNWTQAFSENSNIPNLIYGIGYILISMYIALFVTLLNQKKDYSELDKNIAIDITQYKWLFVYIVLIFIPLFFGGVDNNIVSFVLIIIPFIGILLIGKSIKRMFQWIILNRFSLKISYLRNLKEKNGMGEKWCSLWEAEIINTLNEQKFLEIFSSKIENLILVKQKASLEKLETLLSDFNDFLENRHIENILEEEIFSKILKWHFIRWLKHNEFYKSEGIDKYEQEEYYHIFSFLDILNKTIKKIEELSFKKSRADIFMDFFRNHIDSYKSHESYVKYILDNIFYPIFFDQIADYIYGVREIIWKSKFPNEWKITKKNLKDNENKISKISLNSYLLWVSERITNPKVGFGQKACEVTKNILPEVDPISWARILIFYYSGCDPVTSIMQFWKYGIVTPTFWELDEEEQGVGEEKVFKEIGEKMKKTFELAFLLFGNEFTEEKLDKYIKKLEKLEFEEDSMNQRKKKALIIIFEKMKEVTNSE